MEIFKYVWQYEEWKVLKQWVVDGIITDSEFIKLVEYLHKGDKNSYVNYVNPIWEDYCKKKKDEEWKQQNLEKTEIWPIINKKDIQLMDGVYYCMKEKLVLGIKGGKTKCKIKEGIERIAGCFTYLEDLEDDSICGGKKLMEIVFPNSLKYIGYAVFSPSFLRRVEFPDNVEELEDRAFKDNYDLMEIVLSKNLIRIGEFCFDSCLKLGNVTFPNRLEIIEKYAFCNCKSIKQIVFPDSLKKIGSACFGACTSIENIKFSQGLEYIGRYAFSKCTSIKDVVIPQNVKVIDGNAFSSCTSLKTAKIESPIEELKDGIFVDCIALEKIQLPNSLKKIGFGSFGGCTSLKEVQLPDSIVEIDESAFHNCKSLKRIIIPDEVELIDRDTFRGCISLEEFRFPKNLQVVLSHAFAGCKKLNVVFFNRNVVKIRHDAFDGCDSLQAIVVPSGTRKAMQKLFPAKSSLIKIIVEENEFHPEEIVHSTELKEKIDYDFGDVNRAFLTKFPWSYIDPDKISLLSPKHVLVPVESPHIHYKRKDILNYNSTIIDCYYKIQNDFLKGIFYDLSEREYTPYSFTLFFDIIESYKQNKILENILNQLVIVCKSNPVVARYAPEKLRSVINYSKLDKLTKLKILKIFPDFQKAMTIPDYASVALDYTKEELEKIRLLKKIKINEITLNNTYQKTCNISRIEIIKKVLKVWVAVAEKYDDFVKNVLVGASKKYGNFVDLDRELSLYLNRCFVKVVGKHKVKIKYRGREESLVKKFDDYIDEILELL